MELAKEQLDKAKDAFASVKLELIAFILSYDFKHPFLIRDICDDLYEYAIANDDKSKTNLLKAKATLANLHVFKNLFGIDSF